MAVKGQQRGHWRLPSSSGVDGGPATDEGLALAMVTEPFEEGLTSGEGAYPVNFRPRPRKGIPAEDLEGVAIEAAAKGKGRLKMGIQPRTCRRN